MRNVWTIARREYRHYWLSPIAYLVALSVLLITGIYFVVVVVLVSNQSYMGAGSAPNGNFFIQVMSIIFLFAMPALTMRLLADEQRMGTLELLMTAPLREWELVLGKWFGAFLFMMTIIAFTLVFPFALNAMVTPGIDQQLMVSGYIAIILLASVFLAIGTLFSAIFSNQFAAFFATLATLFLLWWVISWPPYVLPAGTLSDVFNYLALSTRFNNMMGGTLTLSDIVYHLSLTALGLFVGSVVIETRRWR
jgi:gliding motility-associated transport system permease protein